jgi:hypothetical protein
MDPASRDSIDAIARELREKTGAELAVVTLADLGGDEIDPVAVDLYGAWGIGKKGKDEGVLILLAAQERRCIEIQWPGDCPTMRGRSSGGHGARSGAGADRGRLLHGASVVTA